MKAITLLSFLFFLSCMGPDETPEPKRAASGTTQYHYKIYFTNGDSTGVISTSNIDDLIVTNGCVGPTNTFQYRLCDVKKIKVDTLSVKY